MYGLSSLPYDGFDDYDDDDDDMSFAGGGLAQLGGMSDGEQVYADDERLQPFFSGIASPLGAQASQLARMGRGEDKMLMHVTPDELETFQLLAKQQGGSLTINPNTGLPEMGFLSKLWKGVKKVVKKVWKAIKPVAGPVAAMAANFLFPGLSAPMLGLISGGVSGIANKSFKKGLTDGLLTWGGAHLMGAGGGAAKAAGAQGHMVGADALRGAGQAATQVGNVGNTIAQGVADAGIAGAGGAASTIGNAVAQAGGSGLYGGTYSGLGSLGSNAITAAAQPAASAAASQAMGNVAAAGSTAGASGSSSVLGRLGSLAKAAVKPQNIPLTMMAMNTVGSLMAAKEQEKYQKEQQRWEREQQKKAEKMAEPMFDHSQQPALGGGSSMPSNPYYALTGGGHDYGFQYAAGGKVELDPATQKKVQALRKRYRSMQQALDDSRVPGSVAHSLGIHPNDPALRVAFGFTKKQGPKKKKKPVTLASGGSVSMFNEGGLGTLTSGPGDGMSDDIETSIDGQHPARLSDGEFVVPADVVSHLGNGSTDAGAQQLREMMARIREARTGKPQQAPRIDPRGMLPA